MSGNYTAALDQRNPEVQCVSELRILMAAVFKHEINRFSPPSYVVWAREWQKPYLWPIAHVVLCKLQAGLKTVQLPKATQIIHPGIADPIGAVALPFWINAVQTFDARCMINYGSGTASQAAAYFYSYGI